MSAITILRHFVDLLLFVVLTCTYFALLIWVPPRKFGFFCGDESLQYPYIDEETFSAPVLIVITFGTSFVIIFLVEVFRRLPHGRSGGKKHAQHAQQDDNNESCHCGIRWRNIYEHYGYFLVGMVMTLIVVEIPKRTIGRVRPFFFSFCKPRLSDGTTCDLERNHGQYFSEFTCDNDVSKMMLQNVNMSFPSGHSATAFFVMVYLSFYLQVRFNTRGSKLLKHMIQFCFICIATYIALSRVIDHWHHWSDVLAGILIGTLFAWLDARFMSKLFEGRRNAAPLLSAKMFAHSSLVGAQAHTATPGLPAYTFGSLPYLQHHGPNHPAYGQTYHNYGYVP